MARKMFEKAGLIPGLQAGPKAAGDGVPAAESSKAKTAPGTMMGFLTAQSGAVQEAEALKARVRSLEEGAPLRRLDPSFIRQSKWANRHEASFLTPEFQELKAEIAAAGGNVQPIKVRPVSVLNGSTPPGGPTFELIFGHRRHRACAELGIPVLSAIEEASDVSLFEQMERENRGRKNLSAWEQGTMYRRALDDGLYSSLRRLAEGLGVDVSLVSKSVSLARLPEAVVAAFQSPLDIQFRWAAPLTEAMQKDPDGTLSRARAIAEKRGDMGATTVLSKLVGLPEPAPGRSASQALTISKAGKVAARLTADAKGRAVVRFEAGALPETKRKALVKVIEDFLKG
ncbi:MAG: ParB/RepB/Spo0J family partition protein [Methylibium sp.]|uniref:ParB/RepB/Spo0J family partition protein n=1 Tax=Methylibium sp. TaxID=2067992 RepID=UPI0017F2FC43|nr:ParB/RepB/Spo0J family partition protein [Methylibium sp.]MBA3597224.1 ParB/RepB/Spo0J family partition protein [Methylibium sp.]